MKKTLKHSVFGLVLCAMLVFCIGFYSSAEPTTAYFSDTETQQGSYNMKELKILFAGDGISEGVTGTPLELNFKAATKAVDDENENNPDPMFEYAAEFYTFTATNQGDVEATITADITNVSDNTMFSVNGENALQYRIYELTQDSKYEGEVITYISENTDIKQSAVYTDAQGKRIIKVGESYYYPNLAEKLNYDSSEELVIAAADPDVSKTYCIGFWVEYDKFVENSSANDDTGVSTLNFNVQLSLNAEHIHEHEEQG